MANRTGSVRSPGRYRLPVMLAALAIVSACSLAPTYEVPPAPVAAQYRTLGPWVSAEPADRLDRNGWWTMYADPQLDQLEQQLLVNNSDLAAAYSHYAQARALVDQVSSALYPSVSASAVPQRSRQSDTRPLRAGGPDNYNSVTIDGRIDYELDLWGRVRDSVAASKEAAQASAADLASVQLSLQIALADDYIQLRGLDQQTDLLTQTVSAYQRALQLTQTLHNGGVVSALDEKRAQTQLSSAQSQLSQNLGQRALIEHAIAVLVGASASEFQLAEQTALIKLPVIPAGIPSTLLQRRPDIAAAERRVAEANSKIGVARSAYFPSIILSAQGGLQSTAYAGLISAPNLFWTVGPQIAQYVFDGGLRKAKLASAKAAMAEAGERYRSVVLGAFQQIEDNLSLLQDLEAALQQQQAASAAAQQSVALATNRYKGGVVGYLDVVQAQTAQLDAQRAVLDIQTRQLTANVQLIKALGGGWSADTLADSDDKARMRSHSN